MKRDRAAPPRATALALLAALHSAIGGLDTRTLRVRTRDELRRFAYGDGRRGDTEDRIRRRLLATGAIARDAGGRWSITARGVQMIANPQRWISGDLLPVTESEMQTLRGYEHLNFWASIITVLAFVAFMLDGHHHIGTVFRPAHVIDLPDRVDAFLRVVFTFGVGLIVPLIVLLVSERGSDWVALVTRRYRRAKTVADPGPEG